MTINAEAFRKVADAIEEHQRFNLALVALDVGPVEVDPHLLPTDCGTVGCVWGWTVGILDLEIKGQGEEEAAHALGLTAGMDADRLFYADNEHTVWVRLADEYGWAVEPHGWWPGGRMLADESEITADQAADVLRRIADGEVTL